MAATVVWCNKCKTAIWAYDHIRQDVRGLMNMMSMPCPKCGSISSFDGWSGSEETVNDIIESNKREHFPNVATYDSWSVLKYIFALNVKDGKWAISPDCKWFNRPEEEMQSDEFPADLTDDVADLVRERNDNNFRIRALRELQEEDKNDI